MAVENPFVNDLRAWAVGGQILVHCKAAEGEIETNSVLVLDYVTDKVMQQKRLNGDSFVSPDSRFLVVVDDDGDTITVHRVKDNGKNKTAPCMRGSKNFR